MVYQQQEGEIHRSWKEIIHCRWSRAAIIYHDFFFLFCWLPLSFYSLCLIYVHRVLLGNYIQEVSNRVKICNKVATAVLTMTGYVGLVNCIVRRGHVWWQHKVIPFPWGCGKDKVRQRLRLNTWRVWCITLTYITWTSVWPCPGIWLACSCPNHEVLHQRHLDLQSHAALTTSLWLTGVSLESAAFTNVVLQYSRSRCGTHTL